MIVYTISIYELQGTVSDYKWTFSIFDVKNSELIQWDSVYRDYEQCLSDANVIKSFAKMSGNWAEVKVRND